jgi:hypothetical protein
MKRQIWVYVVGIAFIGSLAAAFIPAMAGMPVGHYATGLTLWSVVFFWLYWRSLEKSGGVGAAIGLGVGLGLTFLAAIISGLMR